MPKLYTSILFLFFMISCRETTEHNLQATSAIPIRGTWKLLSGTLIEKGDTSITDYTKDLSFIKTFFYQDHQRFSFFISAT